jgi:hypothetical protein
MSRAGPCTSGHSLYDGDLVTVADGCLQRSRPRGDLTADEDIHVAPHRARIVEDMYS